MEKKIIINPICGRNSFYGKCYAVETETGYTLISYKTPVAEITFDGVFSRKWNGYSATTMRHVNAFRVRFNLPKMGKKEWEALSC